jgi:hypothetical protein
MTTTYTLIEKITVGAAGASSIDFTSIPQTYTDLIVKGSTRRVTDSANNDAIGIRFNGSSSSIYSVKNLKGDGASASSADASSVSAVYGYGSNNPAGATASTFSNFELYIPNYTSSNQKSVSLDGVTENNATTAYAVLSAGLSTTTSAITSMTIIALSSGSFAQYSSFYLYGIAKEGVTPATSSAPYATGGDSIVFDGTYWIHTFTSSGTFTPKKGLTCDYLVVAGGGGGGGQYGSGGGAGGLRSTVTATGGGGSLESALSLAANTGYTVTIGAGGSTGSVIGGANATAGSNSVFSTITSTGGGAGATRGTGPAGNGGSGAGAMWRTNTNGTGTANQGFAGGVALNTSTDEGTAGGGGAGAAGGNVPSRFNGGNGGNGVATSISGSSVTYAGGGGGGAGNNAGTPGAGGNGGTGGGGNGGGSTTVASGTANTGGGGGGGYADVTFGASGGSGIVIVRYAA